MRLAVELYGTVIGHIHGPDARSFDVEITDEARETFGVNSRVMSVAIPLLASMPRQHAGRRRNWFAELLPEGDQLDYMLTQGGVRRGDIPAFLARYGRDVAGALQIWDVDDPSEPRTPEVIPIDAEGIRRLLEDPIGAPLGNATDYGRTSLGGVQPKIVLARTGARWNQALGGFPSTHILKPQLPTRPTVIFDEEYGARLARRLGLAAFDTRVEEFDGLPTLVIERFDRAGGARIHQEDFNQVLGASGNQKYQELGGVVSLARVAGALSQYAGSEDVLRLARTTILAVGIGNLDMHTKNLGLLHPAHDVPALAPAYDQVPLAHASGGDGRLALAVNRKYRHAEITRDDLVSEFESWQLRRAAAAVSDALDELSAAVAEEVPLDSAHPELHDSMSSFVRNLREGRAVGDGRAPSAG